jgi:tripartite-type tricarboxylate transporter receptor subunit TctC
MWHNASPVLLISKTVPAKNLKELIEYAKKASWRELNYASSGSGTIIHLAGEAFKADAGLDIVHIPYKGSTQSISDAISGRDPR